MNHYKPKKAADINIFRDFMYGQYQKYLQAEIYKFKNGSMGGKNGGYSFLIWIIFKKLIGQILTNLKQQFKIYSV